MAAAFRLTRDAQQDLTDIRRYTAQQWGQEQSSKYLLNLRSTIKLLAEFPGQGSKREDVGQGVYSFPCASHMLYYRIEQKQLLVFAVLHQRMLPTGHIRA
ncbi:type II toxin-antitoxin system RelE/ParE family toxin [Thiopseudomonas acetoxidans]|uniref:Toxin n=1 Tax=Thiopseudomonas acetoxidans TaxID=3041622 RepID=A0ABT7SMI4_9GAMM|nr:type II toxin-antitoxin system RelE/ParE family toxin [Thiopseudomonas sp. CY1220]MDM7857393.1 type II toxin-antitoxin system RelE/ParE family toxin [Thiopseudomonas sp. CY1220]